MVARLWSGLGAGPGGKVSPTMIDDIRAIEADAAGRIAGAGSLHALADVERELLGKDSQLTGFKRGLGALEPDARREAGAALNAARQGVEAAVAARRGELADAAAREQARAERLDLTEVRVETSGPGIVARFERPVLRSWQRPPPASSSPFPSR